MTNRVIDAWAKWLWKPEQSDGFPLTVEFHAAPWLYHADGVAKTETEIRVLMEHAARVACRQHRYQPWRYCGWPDRGGPTGFLHHHGWLVIPRACMTRDSLTAVFQTVCKNHETVKSVYVGDQAESRNDIENYCGYAARNGVGEPTVCQTQTQTIAWSETQTKTGWTQWVGAGFTIIGGKPGKGFKVFERPDMVLYLGSRLASAKAWCEDANRERNRNGYSET